MECILRFSLIYNLYKMFKIWIIDYTAWVPNWLLNNLVSYYKMDANGTFPDAHWSNDGTINGATFIASALINWGYDYDGVNDKIDLPFALANTDLNGASSISYTLWIKPDTFSWTQFIHHINNNQLNIRLQSNNIVIEVRSETADNTETGTGTIVLNNTNKWYHIVIDVDFTNDSLVTYIDNVKDIDKVTDFSSSTLNWNANSAYRLGQRTNDFFYNGKTDELWIYSTKLTTDKRTALFNSWAWLSYDSFTS